MSSASRGQADMAAWGWVRPVGSAHTLEHGVMSQHCYLSLLLLFSSTRHHQYYNCNDYCGDYTVITPWGLRRRARLERIAPSPRRCRACCGVRTHALAGNPLSFGIIAGVQRRVSPHSRTIIYIIMFSFLAPQVKRSLLGGVSGK